MFRKTLILLSFPLICVLFVSCGRPGATLTQLNAVQKALANAQPTTVQTAQGLPLQQLGSLLDQLAQNPNVTSDQANVLANPQNQQILQGIIRLVAGGAPAAQLGALGQILGAGGGISNLGGPIAALIQVFTELAPLIEAFDPAIAPFITIALDVLPLIQQFLAAFAPPHPAH